MAARSTKRELARRVARATGRDPVQVEHTLRGFYEEMLRASNERLRGRGERLTLPAVGRFWARPSCRGTRSPRTGEPLPPHWAFWFKPYRKLLDRCRAICGTRLGAGS